MNALVAKCAQANHQLAPILLDQHRLYGDQVLAG